MHNAQVRAKQYFKCRLGCSRHASPFFLDSPKFNLPACENLIVIIGVVVFFMMSRKPTQAITLICITFLLSACTISLTTKVDADGSGEFGFIYKLTQNDLDQISDMGLNPDTICTDMQSQPDSDMPASFAFTQETHGDETWCVSVQSYTSLEKMKSDFSGEGFTVYTLEIKDDIFTFDAVADTSDIDTGGVPVSFNMEFILTAPGPITSHDASKIEGNTAAWNLKLNGITKMHLVSGLSPVATRTPSPTATSTASPTRTATPAATRTASPTKTSTSTATAAPTSTSTSTFTPTPTSTSTSTPTRTPTAAALPALTRAVQKYGLPAGIALGCFCALAVVLVVFGSLFRRKGHVPEN